MQAILTIGVSASGKTTWSNNYVQEKKLANEIWLNINQDEIRLNIIRNIKGQNIDEVKELRAWNYDPDGLSETSVKEYWKTLIEQAISKGYDGLVISDTNLDGGGVKINKLISMGIDANNITTKYFPISFEDALFRDKNRQFSVGENVLKQQFEKLERFLNSQSVVTPKKNHI